MVPRRGLSFAAGRLPGRGGGAQRQRKCLQSSGTPPKIGTRTLISWERLCVMYNPQLETFLRVADAGSFNKAAEELFITPPAVIKQITSLESSLD